MKTELTQREWHCIYFGAWLGAVVVSYGTGFWRGIVFGSMMSVATWFCLVRNYRPLQLRRWMVLTLLASAVWGAASGQMEEVVFSLGAATIIAYKHSNARQVLWVKRRLRCRKVAVAWSVPGDEDE